MFKRLLLEKIKKYANFPAIVLSGPRQSGKTTLVKEAFPLHQYVTFDNDADRSFAAEDPERFLSMHDNEHGLVIDEFQYVPGLLSYIKIEIDTKKRPGYFILTGSQNFLANQAITESLAGRICILNLLPLSIQEMQQNGLLPNNVDDVIFQGGYPRLYDEKLPATEMYSSYVQSYLERDVRQLINVGNLSLFQRFVQLCAGRSGQELNYSNLGADCGITLQTVKNWLSILEASYIIFLLPPHFKNFNKRLIKTPKLYFFDTGLACSLLRISSPEVLSVSPFRGPLFENFIIADLYKQYSNRGVRPPLYFWRDIGEKHEVDCVIDEGGMLTAVEIKSAQTFATDFFKGLEYWTNLAGITSDHAYLIYGGEKEQIRRQGNLIGWTQAGSLIETIERIP